MKRPEQQLQHSCVEFMRYQYPKELFIHVPNGGYRSRVEAKILKSLGVTPGFPDLFLFRSNKRYYGLAIELKAPGGKLTENQFNVITRLLALGYAAFVVSSLDDFMKIIRHYIHAER